MSRELNTSFRRIYSYNLVCTWKKRRKWPDYLVSVGIHTFNRRCSMNQSVHIDYRGLFGGHCPLLNHGSQLIRLFEESFQHTFNQVFCFLAQSDEKQQLNNKSFCREIAQAYLKRLLFRIDIIDEN